MRDDQGDKGNRVAEKGRGRAPPRHEQTGQRRPHQTRAVKDRTIQRDGGRDLLLLHQLRNERVDGRHFEGDADAENRGEHDDVPDLNRARPDQQAEGERVTICTTCVAIRIIRLS